MPAIMVKDYTWRQTPEAVIISTRLVGHPKKLDLFAIDNYMKILEAESECIVGEETAVFTLKKEEIGLEWPSLSMEDSDSDKKRALRSRALELARVNAEERTKARNEKLHSLQRQAVRSQIELDTATLNKIESMRDSHRREAMRELEDWRGRAERPILENISGVVQENRRDYRAPLKWFPGERQAEMSEESVTDSVATDSRSGPPVTPDAKMNGSNENTVQGKNRDSGRVVDASSSGSSSDSSDPESDSQVYRDKKVDEKALRKYYRRKEKENVDRGKELVRRLLNGDIGSLGRRGGGIFDEAEVPVPRPRRCGTINVKFSERQFPTPARESHRLEEQEWLEKQAEARRKSGFVSEDLSAEEQDPLWLKDKGDEFFKAGNYLGAISAYTHGIKLSDKMSSLYVNRSASHYASGNYRRCAEDCSTALRLMLPKCEGNRDSRARCHARLGAALCKLSAPQHGIPELEAALKLDPENETIKRDLLAAKRYFELQH